MSDWSCLAFHLATFGIASTVDEDVALNPSDDPWAPADGAEIIRVSITKEDAGLLAKILAALGEVVS